MLNIEIFLFLHMIWALWGVKYFHSTEGVWNIGCCSVLARTMHAAQWQSLCCNWVLIFSRRSSSLLASKRLLDYIQGTTSIWWCLTTNSELFLIQDHSLLIVHRDFISRLTDLRLCSHIHCIHYQRRNKIETNKNTNRDWTVAGLSLVTGRWNKDQCQRWEVKLCDATWHRATTGWYNDTMS